MENTSQVSKERIRNEVPVRNLVWMLLVFGIALSLQWGASVSLDGEAREFVGKNERTLEIYTRSLGPLEESNQVGLKSLENILAREKALKLPGLGAEDLRRLSREPSGHEVPLLINPR